MFLMLITWVCSLIVKPAVFGWSFIADLGATPSKPTKVFMVFKIKTVEDIKNVPAEHLPELATDLFLLVQGLFDKTKAELEIDFIPDGKGEAEFEVVE